MTEVRYRLGEKTARECIAALLESAPWYAKPQLNNLLERLDGRGIQVGVDRVKRKHTSSQQAYYWLCVNIFAKAQGMTPDEAHGVVLCEATGTREVKIGTHVYPVPVSRSSKMNVEEYSNLIETLLRVAAFCGCLLPDAEAVA